MAPEKTILYFVPHQDDELLTMGIDICNSLNNRWNVHVVLCTDGSNSVVKDILCDRKTCDKHEGMHNYILTAEEFVRARDREFLESCKALGVKEENIHIPQLRYKDGELTVSDGKNIMLQFIEAAGDGCVVCTTDPDSAKRQHPDHKALGSAAKELFEEKKIHLLKLFMEPYHVSPYTVKLGRDDATPFVIQASQRVHKILEKAARSYSRWNPEHGRYGIGFHSVTTEFDDFLKNRLSYYRCYANKTSAEKIIVSLTSYPPRIHCVARSLDTVFSQTLLPDEVILWLAESQFPNKMADLPEELVKLVTDKKLTVCWCEGDLKSHKKYFYAFREYPEGLVITIDDDLLYHSRMIENLYVSWILHPGAVSAVRAHLIPVTEQGKILPYSLWPKEVDACISEPSMQLMATGGAGTLYPVALFSGAANLLDPKMIERTCLWADDLWLKALELVSGIPVVAAEPFQGLRYVPDSQNVGLRIFNTVEGGNDRQLFQIQEEIDNRYGKGFFIRKLLSSSSGKNIVGEEGLCFLLEYYRGQDRKVIKAAEKQIGVAEKKAVIAEKKATETEKKLRLVEKCYEKYVTLRVDIRGKGGQECRVEVKETVPEPKVLRKPTWLSGGVTIESVAGRQHIVLQTGFDGELEIVLRGRDERNEEGHRYPVWIDCMYFAVNGQPIFNSTKTLCHDEQHIYRKKVADGEVIVLDMEWAECHSPNVTDELRKLRTALKRANERIKILEQKQAETEKEQEQFG